MATVVDSTTLIVLLVVLSAVLAVLLLGLIVLAVVLVVRCRKMRAADKARVPAQHPQQEQQPPQAYAYAQAQPPLQPLQPARPGQPTSPSKQPLPPVAPRPGKAPPPNRPRNQYEQRVKAGPEWGPTSSSSTAYEKSGGASGLSSAGASGPSGAGASGPSGAGASGPSGAGASGPSGAGASGPSGAGASGPSGAGASGPSGGASGSALKEQLGIKSHEYSTDGGSDAFGGALLSGPSAPPQHEYSDGDANVAVASGPDATAVVSGPKGSGSVNYSGPAGARVRLHDYTVPGNDYGTSYDDQQLGTAAEAETEAEAGSYDPTYDKLHAYHPKPNPDAATVNENENI